MNNLKLLFVYAYSHVLITYGINSNLFDKVQSVQNTAASKYHWLKVKERIIFKICLIVNKCYHGTAPVSLKAMISYHTSTPTLKLVEHPY